MTDFFHAFRESVIVQGRIIYALLMREIITRYGRHNIGFLWLFVEPMMFTLGVTAIWSAIKLTHGSELPIVAFGLTGYSCILAWRNSCSRCIAAVTPNLSLMYHRNVRVIDIFLARIIIEVSGATISLVSLSIVFVSLEWMHLPENILLVALGWVMIGWFGASLGIFLGALSEISEVVEKLWHPAAYLLFPLSGAAFLVDSLPSSFQNFVLWLPMVHGTEMVRAGYFGSLMRPHYSLSYMALFCTAVTICAFAAERYLSRKIILE